MTVLQMITTPEEDWVKSFDPHKRILKGQAYFLAKRLMDLFLVLLTLPLWLPLNGMIALIIRITSPGAPVVFKQLRTGKGGRRFSMYKFRTMVPNAEELKPKYAHLNELQWPDFKIAKDPRIIPVGKFLRKTSLDELPQFLNVLLGDMSLVGNRPLPLYEAAALTTDEWAKRFMAPAGITGLWQIKKRGQDEMSTEERLTLDIDYAERNNFMYDLWIMANTPSALIQKTNA